MPQGLQVWDASGNIMFDTADRIVGGFVTFTTGQASGSHTATPLPGQSVEFVYSLPVTWQPAGNASRWPVVSVVGNTIHWSFNPAVPTAQRTSIPIMKVFY